MVGFGCAVNCRFGILMLSLCTDNVDDFEKGEDLVVLRSKFQEAAARDNDLSRAIIWAGASVGDMKDIKPAKVCFAFHRMKFENYENFIDDLPLNRRWSRNCIKSA